MDAGEILESYALELLPHVRAKLQGAALAVAKQAGITARAEEMAALLPELLALADLIPIAPIPKGEPPPLRDPSIMQGESRCRWRAGLVLVARALVGLPPSLSDIPTPSWRDCWPYRDPEWPGRANGRAQGLEAVWLWPAFGVNRLDRTDVLTIDQWIPWAGPFGFAGLSRDPQRFGVKPYFNAPPPTPPGAEYFYSAGWLASLSFSTSPTAWREAATDALFKEGTPAWAREVARRIVRSA